MMAHPRWPSPSTTTSMDGDPGEVAEIKRIGDEPGGADLQ